MEYSNHDRIPAELEGIEARLRDECAGLTPLELDRIKLRAIQQADRSRPSFLNRQKGKMMKSKLALTLVIATGLLMSTGGATMAISGSSGSGNAAQNEYADPDGTEELGSSAGDDSGVPPQDDQVATASTDSGSLPFTGFAAIPLLIIGLGFVSVGLFLRFKTGDHTDS